MSIKIYMFLTSYINKDIFKKACTVILCRCTLPNFFVETPFLYLGLPEQGAYRISMN